jgi:hypothetical protein
VVNLFEFRRFEADLRNIEVIIHFREGRPEFLRQQFPSAQTDKVISPPI